MTDDAWVPDVLAGKMDAPAEQYAMLEEYTPVIESYRQMGVFPPAVSVPTDASPQVRLMAMAGRE